MKIEYTEIKTRNTAVTILAFTLLSSSALLFLIYPYRPNSFYSWVLFILSSFPLIVILELIGGKLLGNKFISNLNKSTRIFYGAIIGIVFIFISLLFEPHIHEFFGKWAA